MAVHREKGWLLVMLVAVAVAVAVVGCGRDAPPPAAPVALDKTFLADTAAWRKARLNELRAPDGWTSLVGLHWLSLKAHYIGSSADSGIRLAVGPPKMGMVSTENNAVWFVPERGAALTLDGKPLTSRIRFQSDRDPQPTRIYFDDGKGVLSLIHRGDRDALRVKHADASSRTHFAGLDYWPLDPSWRITARYVPNAVGKTIPIVDIVGISSEQPNAGASSSSAMARPIDWKRSASRVGRCSWSSPTAPAGTAAIRPGAFWTWTCPMPPERSWLISIAPTTPHAHLHPLPLVHCRRRKTGSTWQCRQVRRPTRCRTDMRDVDMCGGTP